MSLELDIADALVAELSGHAFGPAFVAQRRFRVEFTPEQLQTLRVSVVPKSYAEEAATRSETQQDVEVDIGVQQHVGVDDDLIETLMSLVEDVREFLRGRSLAGARWVATANEPIFSPEHLAKDNVFTSVITLTYRNLA